jgi:hypothetical protein
MHVYPFLARTSWTRQAAAFAKNPLLDFDNVQNGFGLVGMASTRAASPSAMPL